MNYDFNKQLKSDADKHGMGSGKSDNNYYNFEEGNQNVLRIMMPATSYVSYFIAKGTPPAVSYGAENGDPRSADPELKRSVKYATYVLDRKTNTIKLCSSLPYSIMRAIAEFQTNPDYAFDDLPMPYDIRVTYKKDESPANKYHVAAVPFKVPVTEAEMNELADRMKEITPEQLVEKMKQKQMKKDEEAGIKLPPGVTAAFQKAVEQKEPTPPKYEQPKVEYPTEEKNINPDDIPF